MNFELVSFASADELAARAASAWLDEIAASNHAARPHCVALSGGRIALKFFTSVVAQAKAREHLARPRPFFLGGRTLRPARRCGKQFSRGARTPVRAAADQRRANPPHPRRRFPGSRRAESHDGYFQCRAKKFRRTANAGFNFFGHGRGRPRRLAFFRPD